MNASQKTYSWAFLSPLKMSMPVCGWEVIKRLIEKSREALIPRLHEYWELESQWAVKLRAVCGDHNICDWSKFRPLRLSREEDWSDWLAWLLETSQTGILAASLFAEHICCKPECFGSPKAVKREDPSGDDRRADIVVAWNTGKMSSVEVKVWDRNLDKTFETAMNLRLQYGVPESDWSDFILIPRESTREWDEVARTHTADGTKINFILWDDVVHGLRNCLWNECETVFWRAWAWTFCCMIEKRILHLDNVSQELDKPNPLEAQMALRWLNVLTPKFPD